MLGNEWRITGLDVVANAGYRSDQGARFIVEFLA